MSDHSKPERLWNEYEAAFFLGISIHTMRKWRQLKVIPFIKLNNGTVRFQQSALQQWIDDHTVVAAPDQESGTKVIFLRSPEQQELALRVMDEQALEDLREKSLVNLH